MGDRRSSFAASFFAAAGAAAQSYDDDDDDGNNGLGPNVPVPKSRPRRMSRKQLSFVHRSGRGSGSFQSNDGSSDGGINMNAINAINEMKLDESEEFQQAQQQAQQQQQQQQLQSHQAVGSEPQITPRSSFNNGPQEVVGGAVAAGAHVPTHVNQNAFGIDANGMAEIQDAALEIHEDADGRITFPDEEVLEQYRIMAQYEASIRVKENTGMDLEDYERRRKTSQNNPKNKKELYGGGKKTKLRMPKPKMIIPTPPELRSEKAPPIPITTRTTNNNGGCGAAFEFVNMKYPSTAHVPELCNGVIHRGSTSALNANEHIVRCLGCRGSLKVHLYSTLVCCPECQTISSTSSTRI